MGPALVVMARSVTLRVDRPQGGLTRGGRSGRVASMKHRHDVSEAELTRALQRALLHAIEECRGTRDIGRRLCRFFGEPFRRCFAAGNADRGTGQGVSRQARSGAGAARRRRARVKVRNMVVA